MYTRLALRSHVVGRVAAIAIGDAVVDRLEHLNLLSRIGRQLGRQPGLRLLLHPA